MFDIKIHFAHTGNSFCLHWHVTGWLNNVQEPSTNEKFMDQLKAAAWTRKRMSYLFLGKRTSPTRPANK